VSQAHYNLNLTSIRVPGLNVTESGFDQCNTEGSCIADTGNSYLQLPLETSMCLNLQDLILNVTPPELEEIGSMLLDLEGVDGNTVTLSIPMIFFAEQLLSGRVICTNTTGDFALGFPIFQYYYLVHDMAGGTVTFVDLQLSNETEDFIEGPELGGFGSQASYNPTSTSVFLMTSGLLMLVSQYIF